MTMCAKKRGVVFDWGTAAIVHLGLSAEVRQLASSAQAWHWNPFYTSSPYLSSTMLRMMPVVSENIAMEKAHCTPLLGEAPSSTCCIGDDTDRWTLFLDKLNTYKDGQYKTEKNYGRFTYVITAPQESENIEWRIAKMELNRKRNGTRSKMYDMKSKHAWLANRHDWVLYAGEMWIQAKPGTSASAVKDVNDLMLVLDTNSGTFSPGAELGTRRTIQKMIMSALRVGPGQVAVCPGPFQIDQAGGLEAAGTLVASPEDPCAQIAAIYAPFYEK